MHSTLAHFFERQSVSWFAIPVRGGSVKVSGLRFVSLNVDGDAPSPARPLAYPWSSPHPDPVRTMVATVSWGFEQLPKHINHIVAREAVRCPFIPVNLPFSDQWRA